MFEEGITVFLVHGFDRQLLTVDHGTDTIVAALHLEHGKMVNLLTVLGLQLVKLIQRNGLGSLCILLNIYSALSNLGLFGLLCLFVIDTLSGHVLQVIDDSHTMTVTHELRQVLVKRGVLEVDIGNSLFTFFLLLVRKTLLDHMLLLQACRLGDLFGILTEGFIEVALTHQK